VIASTAWELSHFSKYIFIALPCKCTSLLFGWLQSHFKNSH